MLGSWLQLEYATHRPGVKNRLPPAEGHLPWPGVLLVGELAQVPHYPER